MEANPILTPTNVATGPCSFWRSCAEHQSFFKFIKHAGQLNMDISTPKTVFSFLNKYISLELQDKHEIQVQPHKGLNVCEQIILNLMQTTASVWICSYPKVSSGLPVLPPLPVSFFAEPPPFVFGFVPTPGIFPPLSAAALRLPFSGILPPFSGSLQASFPAPLSPFELVPVKTI